jgi:hypothetical protein
LGEPKRVTWLGPGRVREGLLEEVSVPWVAKDE